MIAEKLGNEDAALYRFTHPVQPAQPVIPAPKPALSDTVLERNPYKRPPQQPSHLSEPHLTSSQSTVQMSANSQPGIGGPSHPPRKGSKAAPQYAAGSAKTPIMLAIIKVQQCVQLLLRHTFFGP